MRLQLGFQICEPTGLHHEVTRIAAELGIAVGRDSGRRWDGVFEGRSSRRGIDAANTERSSTILTSQGAS
jgi:hypothetical protein